MKKNLVYIIFALFTLPLLIITAENIQKIISRAAPNPANLVIDTQNSIGILNKSWEAFAQGGEEPPPMLTNAVSKIKELSPKYIRLDHIYDYYEIVKKGSNGFTYDFTKLDQTVDDIIASGAIPFFSLSYMPPPFTETGSVIDKPANWNNWQELVKNTIEHFSGKNNKNLQNVYYEVWNEPELPQFGNWKLGGPKDYRLLYYYASQGANDALDVNSFKIGGPGVGSFYPDWINELASYSTQNHLRLDFYSWHRYHQNPNVFVSDAENTSKKLSQFPQYANLPLIISEWGIDSENTAISNSNIAAAHTATSIIKFHDLVNLGFAFEIKDGPPPTGGKWGLITHEKNQTSLSPKPRFKTYKAFSQLTGEKLAISGEGTFISAIAAKNGDEINVLISNYDQTGRWSENVPITFTGLTPASWILNYSYPLDDSSGKFEIISTDGKLTKSFLMPANSLVLLNLSKSAPLATFISGKTTNIQDQAFVLSTSDTSLIFRSPQFTLRSSGSISFDIKPFWQLNNNKSILIFDAPFSTTSATLNKLFLAKQQKPEGNYLTFGIASNKEEVTVSIPIDNWGKDEWHRIQTNWKYTGLSLAVDNQIINQNETPVDIRNGEILSFYPIEAAIDNLKITLGDNQEISRNFDGTIDK